MLLLVMLTSGVEFSNSYPQHTSWGYSRLFVMQVAREAAEEVKEAVAAAGAKASAGDEGLDMFADNVDADMFAGTPLLPQGTAPAKKALLDNYDDAEGYYNFQVSGSRLDVQLGECFH